MPCTSPILALRLIKPAVGKQSTKILPRRVDMTFEALASRYGSENILELPCGHCASCLKNRSKEWMIRCACESFSHLQNCFITLTYDDFSYSKRDVKNDWKSFIKSLRNDGHSVRYFGCCERGDQFGRQHFHLILFGYMPGDLKPFAKSDSGFMQFTSDYLSSIWKKGFVTVAEFHPATGAYVAGYVLKKFELGDSDSFHFQSTRPGIGAYYAVKNIERIYQDDKLILNFGSRIYSIPRYFDKLAEAMGIDISVNKDNRLNRADAITYARIRDLGFESKDQLLIHDYNNSKKMMKKRKF